ncbi:MAG: hypothetical protein EBY21_00775 [Alphaproteobacteria bacterium]|nr:hypothetical protein [Alphaproteobacteria bacterium]
MSLAKAKAKVAPKAKVPHKAKAPQKTKGTQKTIAAKAGAAKARKPAAKPAHPEQTFALNTQAQDLTKALTAAFQAGSLHEIEPRIQQGLIAALLKIYGAQIEEGATHALVGGRTALTSTDAMIACHSLLKATDLQVFDLGVWQSWTGR